MVLGLCNPLPPHQRDSQCLQRGRILSCPPTSHTVKEMFLYSTVSTLKPGVGRNVRRRRQFQILAARRISLSRNSPMVGMVVTISPSFSL